MAIKIDLYFFNDEYGTIENAETNYETNNISDISRIVDDSSNIEKPFILGLSKLNSGNTLMNEYNGVISYANEFIFSITTTLGFQAFKIIYDTHFSKDITTIINGIEYRTFNGIQNIVFNEKVMGTITIKAISNDNLPIAIKYVKPYGDMNIGANRINNLVIGEQLSSEINLPSFGYVGNYGNVEITDIDNEISSLIEKANYKTIKVAISNNDTMINNYYVSDVSKQNDSNKIKFTFKDFNENLLNQEYKAMHEPLTMYSVLNGLGSKLGKNLVFEDENLKNEITKTQVRFTFYREKSSILSLINDFCVATMTCIKINSENIEVFRYV